MPVWTKNKQTPNHEATSYFQLWAVWESDTTSGPYAATGRKVYRSIWYIYCRHDFFYLFFTSNCRSDLSFQASLLPCLFLWYVPSSTIGYQLHNFSLKVFVPFGAYSFSWLLDSYCLCLFDCFLLRVQDFLFIFFTLTIYFSFRIKTSILHNLSVFFYKLSQTI